MIVVEKTSLNKKTILITSNIEKYWKQSNGIFSWDTFLNISAELCISRSDNVEQNYTFLKFCQSVIRGLKSTGSRGFPQVPRVGGIAGCSADLFRGKVPPIPPA